MIILNQTTRVGKFWNIEYERSGDTNKNLLVKEYIDKIKPYLRDNNLSSKI